MLGLTRVRQRFQKEKTLQRPNQSAGQIMVWQADSLKSMTDLILL